MHPSDSRTRTRIERTAEVTADLADRAGEEIVGLGKGVTLAVSVQTGRPTGSSVEVQIRFASIQICEDGLIVWMKNYNEIDENRQPPNG